MRKSFALTVIGLACLLHSGGVTAQSSITHSKSPARPHIGHAIPKTGKADAAIEAKLDNLVLRLKKQGRLGKVHSERNSDGSLKSFTVEVRAAPNQTGS